MNRDKRIFYQFHVEYHIQAINPKLKSKKMYMLKSNRSMYQNKPPEDRIAEVRTGKAENEDIKDVNIDALSNAL